MGLDITRMRVEFSTADASSPGELVRRLSLIKEADSEVKTGGAGSKFETGSLLETVSGTLDKKRYCISQILSLCWR